MTIITDEMIEKAADAIATKRFGLVNGVYGARSDDEIAKLYARTALEAVLPDVVEEAEIASTLKAIAILQKVHAKNWDQEDFRESALSAISVPAIRILLNKEDGNG